MRYLYILLIHVAAPVAYLIEVLRGVKDPAYRGRRSERLGFGPRATTDCIWVHAVSVGEVQAAAPLVRRLLERYPGSRLMLTTVTPTGAARCTLLFGGSVEHRYVPLDLPGAVRRFFDRARPRIAIIIETEIWPNLFAECGRRGVPLVLASARISPRSVGRYRRLVPLFRETLSHGIVIAAQSETDAERFLSIGAVAARTHVTGNIKFDFEPHGDALASGAAWRRDQAAGRPLWVAGSTHEGEEETLLDAHALLCGTLPEAVLVLVPRHPQRFGEVAQLLERRGIRWVSRSAGGPVTDDTAVVLGDTMGELTMFYAAADVAFVAGSLVPVGGHNLLEPAALGKPILTGRHNFNGEDIYHKLGEAGAVSTVADAAALAAALAGLLADGARRRAQGEKGLAVLQANRGALGRLLALLAPLLDTTPVERGAGQASAVLPTKGRLA